ncbi:MAG: RNA methyltransferase [Silvanigrellaceae bacterium]
MNLRLVIVNPMHATNLGAIARLAGNFGVTDVVVVSPRCDVLSSEARALATTHAGTILESFKVVSSLREALEGAGYAVGFSRRTGDMRRPDMAWSDLPTLPERSERVDLVFGPEDTGLSQDDLTLCSAICTLPTNPKVPSLNLSQAVGIVLAGCLWNALPEGKQIPSVKTRFEAERPITAEGLLHLVSHWRQTMVDVGLTREGNPDRLLHYFHRILNRAELSEREGNMLRGFFSQVQVAIGKRQIRKDDSK